MRRDTSVTSTRSKKVSLTSVMFLQIFMLLTLVVNAAVEFTCHGVYAEEDQFEMECQPSEPCFVERLRDVAINGTMISENHSIAWSSDRHGGMYIAIVPNDLSFDPTVNISIEADIKTRPSALLHWIRIDLCLVLLSCAFIMFYLNQKQKRLGMYHHRMFILSLTLASPL